MFARANLRMTVQIRLAQGKQVEEQAASLWDTGLRWTGTLTVTLGASGGIPLAVGGWTSRRGGVLTLGPITLLRASSPLSKRKSCCCWACSCVVVLAVTRVRVEGGGRCLWRESVGHILLAVILTSCFCFCTYGLALYNSVIIWLGLQ